MSPGGVVVFAGMGTLGNNVSHFYNLIATKSEPVICLHPLLELFYLLFIVNGLTYFLPHF